MKLSSRIRLFVSGGIASLLAVGMAGLALSAYAAQASTQGTLHVVSAATPVQTAAGPGPSMPTQTGDTAAVETPDTAHRG